MLIAKHGIYLNLAVALISPHMHIANVYNVQGTLFCKKLEIFWPLGPCTQGSYKIGLLYFSFPTCEIFQTKTIIKNLTNEPVYEFNLVTLENRLMIF